MARKPRQPRKPRAQSRRTGTQQSNNSGQANRAMRARIVSLESRMVLLERFLDKEWTEVQDSVLSEKHAEEMAFNEVQEEE